MFRKLFLVLFFSNCSLISAGNACASEVQLKTARLGQLTAFQANGNYFSGVLLWTPAYRLNDKLQVGLDLGGSLLSIRNHTIFLAPEYVLKGIYDVHSRFSIDAGIGAQTWINNGGTFLELVANGAYHFEEKFLNVIDQVWLGYALIDSSLSSTHEIRLGIAFNL